MRNKVCNYCSTVIFVFFFLTFQIAFAADTIRKDYATMSGEAKCRAEREIFEKFGMKAVVSGGGAITVLRLDELGVQTGVPFSVPEGRRLLIACSEILLRHLNEHRPLRPFLFEYPFPIERIAISIAVDPYAEKTMPKDAVTICSLRENFIRYFRSQEDLYAPMTILHKETLQEALEIVTKEDKSLQLPRNPLTPREVRKGLAEIDEEISEISKFVREGEEESDTPRYVGPMIERKMLWDLDDFAVESAKKYGMEFHLAGNFSDGKNEVYPLVFINFRPMTLEQGKEFAHGVIKDFWGKINTSPVVKKYNEWRNRYYEGNETYYRLTEKPIPEHMGVKIGFWDKNFDRPKKPYLAEIVFLEGNFFYYQANPQTQARELVFQESFTNVFGNSEK